ncbi:malate:quinone oxidoreductase [Macrococcus sp. DPC7161]|uniref:malate:quinone oxidoreductase n=1 Tax=Macrococcus sp. DPC7161 TaxID=2507060 RepID=UPI00100B5C2C|nr:malate:quinone oxidoreductase [Macrococcus sp. DPC7161]RXK17908.1 malate:quinone oxidoreductase [Macrococcus sp. DPC7161]
MQNGLEKSDVILIGGGIMSATLGVLLKELDPTKQIKMFEALEEPALESSNAWNNAGTGHSALCELNYTPQDKAGNVDITKAIRINEQFQISKQLWAYLVRTGKLKNPSQFIKAVPHLSFVQGDANVDFLHKRYEALKDNPLFKGIEYTEDHEKIKSWVPLMMEGRSSDEKIALTKIDAGTDVNFGQLTKDLFEVLEQSGAELNYNHKVTDIKQVEDGSWQVTVLHQGKKSVHNAKFVFIGAGGYSLPLLQKTGIKESKHVGGFPVSGLFLVCKDEKIANQHLAKVYGKAKVGAPPMSVPHLDTRYIDGKRALLFGPYAGFSPKFLKTGSYLDLIKSVKPNNIITMLASGAKEMKLTQYLISQVLQSNDKRIEELREFVPNAKAEDWEIVVAGQRVQVIKDTEKGRGTLQFGTEVIANEAGTIAALLGASPGASTAVHVMLDVMNKCFKSEMSKWTPQIQEMIPSYGKALSEHPELFEQINKDVAKTLEINE